MAVDVPGVFLRVSKASHVSRIARCCYDAVFLQCHDGRRFVDAVGLDNEGPRQAIPYATTNNGTLYDYDRYYAEPSTYYDPQSGRRYYVAPPVYYVAPPATYYVPPATTYYVPAPSYYVAPYGVATYPAPAYRASSLGEALSYCESQPLADRAACRDAAYAGRY